ncbi:S-adenosyl-L-methionine-dependent methyltransferase [Phascolomyces articulosus]|uniref:S-adenosyl-L-methionine-dependent methyltransferase n=1 Tax=Phascolomyces articulosus TaxID=60185 RepID=A0AAD5JTY4_9FUNG|nr:S-adenosyl-L-methionine-dependent methyltransferase [Phascolomyces articulosus]
MIKHPQASMRKSFSSGSESGDSTDTNKTSSSSGRMVPISAISNDDYPIDTGSAAMISAVATAMAASTPSMGSHTTSNGDGSTNAPQLMSTSNGTANNSNRIKGNKNSIQNNNNEQRPNMNAATLLHPSESGNISNEEKQKHQPECESQINNASERLLMELYLLPESDGRRRRERDRQQRQHYLLKYVWRANFKVPLQSPSLIVNWCCGTGIWAMEMAQQFPNCHVVGMDFQSATLSSLGRSIKNLSFQNVIMQRDKTGLESLEEGTVDYLMMRDVWLVNSPGHKWFETLAEVFRILKPGGWVEIYEQDMGVHSPGPYMHIADDLYGNMYKGVGIPRTISDELSFMMNKIGYIKIDERAIELPVGEWSSVPALKETGYLFKDLMVRRFRTFAPWLSEFSDISLDEVNHILDKCIVECEEYKTSMCWRYFAAQKPPQQEKKAGLSD